MVHPVTVGAMTGGNLQAQLPAGGGTLFQAYEDQFRGGVHAELPRQG